MTDFHEHASQASPYLCSQHMFVLVIFTVYQTFVIKPKKRTLGLTGAQFSSNKAEAELCAHCNESPGNCFERLTL